MNKKRRLSKIIRKLPIVLAAGGLGFAVHAGQSAKPDPRPDPQAVVTYLAQLEQAEQTAGASADHRQAGAKKRIRNFVEGAAVRAPSDALINRIETTVAAPSG